MAQPLSPITEGVVEQPKQQLLPPRKLQFDEPDCPVAARLWFE
jgi:hypothetical protein